MSESIDFRSHLRAIWPVRSRFRAASRQRSSDRGWEYRERRELVSLASAARKTSFRTKKECPLKTFDSRSLLPSALGTVKRRIEND